MSGIDILVLALAGGLIFTTALFVFLMYKNIKGVDHDDTRGGV